MDQDSSHLGSSNHPHQVGRGVVPGAPMTVEAVAQTATQTTPPPPVRRGLSLAFKLLALTLGFVLLAEVLIFLPSVGRAQRDYLEERLAFGHLAILALDAAPDGMVDPKMQMTLLRHADADLVAVRSNDGANRVLSEAPPQGVNRQLILNDLSFFGAIYVALETILRPSDGKIRVVGMSPTDRAVEVEVVVETKPVRAYLTDFAIRIALLSLFISVATASLIYAVLVYLIVRPVERMTAAMRLFALDPEDQRFDQVPSKRRDELGEAERQFTSMRNTVRQALHQKSRLAALGTGLTKITHDLRNVMSTTILLSDGLETSKDPMVQRVAPKLSKEISRAEALCLATVTFATGGPVELDVGIVNPAELIVNLFARFQAQTQRLASNLDPALNIRGDSLALDRLFDNLLRNAVQMGATEVDILGRIDDGKLLLTITDNGPGLPPRAQEHLFAPFAGSARKGGTGLGLPLSRDIARAHGGDLRLLSTTSGEGAQFELSLPL